MIISGAEIASAISAYRAPIKKKPRVESISHDSDSYEASTPLSFAAFTASVMSEPMYRTGLVSELGRRISEGRYFVSADEIVEKMIGRLLAEAVLA